MTTITTQAALRRAFHHETGTPRRMVRHRTLYRQAVQNEYPADVRAAWVDFVDAKARAGTITEALASRATL